MTTDPFSALVKQAEYLTVEEVAAWLKVSPEWVRAHANGNRRPKIPSVKLGRFRRFDREQVEQFLKAYANQETAA